MSDNLNKVILIGNVGSIKFINYDGGSKQFASISLATSKNWLNKQTNERQSKTEWHRVVVYNENFVNLLTRRNVGKGAKLYIEGSLVNRKWCDKNNNDRVTTEIILQGFSANLLILPVGRNSEDQGSVSGPYDSNFENSSNKVSSNSKNNSSDYEIDDFDNFLNSNDFDEEDDKIPF